MKECPVCKQQFEEGLYGFEIVFKNQALMLTFDDKELCDSCVEELSDLVDEAVMDTNVPVAQNLIKRRENREI